MAIKTFKRYEKKYLLNENQFTALCEKIAQHMSPDKHCRNGEHYTIYNIYYDTDNNDLIRHSLSKPYYKEKLRLRTYKVPESLEEEVFLELKKKIGGIVCKRRATMSLQEAYDFIQKGKKPISDSYVNNQVIEEIAYFLSRNEVSPRAFISYERMAYFGKEDKEFRLTFDNHIKTRRSSLYLEEGEFGRELIGEKQYLMEVKISGSMPIWLTNIFSELKIYSTSFSKYGREYKRYCSEVEREDKKVIDHKASA